MWCFCRWSQIIQESWWRQTALTSSALCCLLTGGVTRLCLLPLRFVQCVSTTAVPLNVLYFSQHVNNEAHWYFYIWYIKYILLIIFLIYVAMPHAFGWKQKHEEVVRVDGRHMTAHDLAWARVRVWTPLWLGFHNRSPLVTAGKGCGFVLSWGKRVCKYFSIKPNNNLSPTLTKRCERLNIKTSTNAVVTGCCTARILGCKCVWDSKPELLHHLKVFKLEVEEEV